MFALVVMAAALGSAGCTGIASPRGWASPVAVGDQLLVAHRDRLFALDPNSFGERWSFPPKVQDGESEDLIALYGTPALRSGTVYLPAYDDRLYALNAEDGALRWRFDSGGPIIGGVTASDDTVYFGSEDGHVYATEAESPRVRWTFETGDKVWSRPTLAGGTLFVTSLDRSLYALDAATGELQWSFETDAGIASPAVVDEAAGLVFVGGLDGRMRAIDLETHQERWSFKADNWFWTEPLLSNGTLYAGNLDGKVYAWEAGTGEPRWPAPFEAQSPVRSATLLLDDELLVLDRDGAIYFLSATEGSLEGEPLLLASDVLTDPLALPATGSEASKRVVAVTAKGELVLIDAGARRVETRALPAD